MVKQVCLNPCFNGRCTRTSYYLFYKGALASVLILVLMEDALALTEDEAMRLDISMS